jgi:hypothetical protein
MSTEDKSPSLGDKAVNLAKFSWDLIKYVHSTGGTALTVSDEVYAERIKTCKGCDRYMELENECKECGCYVPMKAKVILDSCPLDKWAVVTESEWEETFSNIQKKMES